MGLITKTVKVKWNSRIKKHYEELGYVYTKMGEEFEVKIEDLQKGSHAKVECFCDNCKEQLPWTYKEYNKYVKEDGKTYCNKCAMKLYGTEKYKKTRIKKGKSFEQWCIENDRQDILDRWDYELNGCSPKDVCYGTKRKYWFKCSKHVKHKSELKSINNLTNGQEGSIECNQCSSIGQYIVDNFGEEFLWRVWSSKNEISPFKVSCGSEQKFLWNCPDNKHNSFKRDCKNSKKYDFRCPQCIEEREESLIEEKTRLYLENLGYEVLIEHNCTIRPINPKTNRPLPFDNEIVLENGKHLIIEVHGRQHYEKGTYSKTEEELYQRKLYDRYKRIKCIQTGYYYLELPYTLFDKEETYKKIIDNKIREILEKEE